MSRIVRTTRMTCVCAIALLMMGALHAQNTVLHITVVSGDGAIYPAGTRAAKSITIQVTDATGQPVEGARTSFQLPEDGPGGLFLSGLRTDLAITDANGRATLRGIEINRIAGPFTIRITAAKDLARAGIVVKQYINDAKNAVESADRKAPPARIANPAAVAPVIAAAAPTPPKAAPETAPSKPTGVPTIVYTSRTPRPIGQPMASSSHKSHKKWVWLGILAAGGAAGAFAGHTLGAAAANGTTGTAGAASGVSIGAPTITIGKP